MKIKNAISIRILKVSAESSYSAIMSTQISGLRILLNKSATRVFHLKVITQHSTK